MIRGIFFLFLLLSVTNGWATPTRFEICLREFKEVNDSLVKNLILAEEVGRHNNSKFNVVLSDWISSKKEVERKKAEIISEIRRNPSETLAAMEKFLQSKAGKGSRNLFADLIDLNKNCLVTKNVMSIPVNKGVSVRNSVNTTSTGSPGASPGRIEMKKDSGPVLTIQQQYEALIKLFKALTAEENREKSEARNVHTPENIMKFLERSAQNQEDLARQILAIRYTSPKLKQVAENFVKVIEVQIASIRQMSYTERTKDKRAFGALTNDMHANYARADDLMAKFVKVAVEELGPEKAEALIKDF